MKKEKDESGCRSDYNSKFDYVKRIFYGSELPENSVIRKFRITDADSKNF